MTEKQQVLETISSLPEHVSFQQIVEEVEILAAIRRGEAAADAGRTTSHAEMESLLSAWTLK